MYTSLGTYTEGTYEPAQTLPKKMYQIIKTKSSVALTLANHILESQKFIKDNERGIKTMENKLKKIQEGVRKADLIIKTLELGIEEAKKLLIDQYNFDYDALICAEKI